MVTANDDEVRCDRGVSVELVWSTVLLGVINPSQPACIFIEGTEEATARTNEKQIPRDRGGRKNSSTGLGLPKDG